MKVVKRNLINQEQLEFNFDSWAFTEWFKHNSVWQAKRFLYREYPDQKSWVVIAVKKEHYSKFWYCELFAYAGAGATKTMGSFKTEEECKETVMILAKNTEFYGYELKGNTDD